MFLSSSDMGSLIALKSKDPNHHFPFDIYICLIVVYKYTVPEFHTDPHIISHYIVDYTHCGDLTS